MTLSTKNDLPEKDVNVNIAGEMINPSTEEKQNDILVKMPTLESNGGVPVNIQDQTTTIVDLFFREVLNSITLVVDATPNSNIITLLPGHGVVIGNTIFLKQGSSFFQSNVLAVSTNTITLDSPIDSIFTTTAIGQRCNKNMAVDGSIVPRIFFITSANLSIDFDITHLNFYIQDNNAMDSTTFGGNSPLTKGIVLRRKDGVLKNYFNIKTNGDFGNHCDYPSFLSKIGGGEYSLYVKKRFAGQENSGVTIRLLASENDELQIIIQDNISTLTQFYCVAHGHVVGN